MWTRTYSKTFQGLKREDIWRIWTDINNWPTWHGDLDYCKLEGDFKVGNHFFLKPKGVQPVKIVLTEINEGYSFTDCTSFFGAKMYDTHAMEETVEGLKLTNTLVVTGPLKWLWIKLVAQNVADTIAEETESLIKLARGLNV
ncbi:MAG: polyketide cyclase [Gammaproteobacteria bacterium]|nr:polyketide cyclase [Gammaproteobacteria bacterium]